MFICTRCGLCCKHIDTIPELNGFHDGDGICKFLTADNMCGIYEIRPDICNVEKMYQLRYKNTMTKDEYENLNTLGCSNLKAYYHIGLNILKEISNDKPAES